MQGEMGNKRPLSQVVRNTDTLRETALRAYIEAHQQYAERYGGMAPLPMVRSFRVGNVEIPPEIARHIGRWSIPIKVDPRGMKGPGDRW